MAGKNSAERNGTPGRPRNSSTSKMGSKKTSSDTNDASSTISKATTTAKDASPRFSPLISDRTSPGVIAGYFAGGKWTEPPSPTELPKPPQQWFVNKCSSFNVKSQDIEISNRHKVLLNMHA